MVPTSVIGRPAARADAPESSGDAALWNGLASARETGEFCQRWLALQCRMIESVSGAVVLVVGQEDDSYTAAAVWPEIRRDMGYLGKTAQQAIAERRTAVVARRTGDSLAGYEIAFPLEADGRMRAVVVLDVAPRGEPELQNALRQLRWGVTGLASAFYRDDVMREQGARQRLQGVLAIVAASASQERYAAAATALATELATRLDCERVAIGFLQHGRVQVDALSHSASVEGNTNLLRALAAAMEECVDQGVVVGYPASPGMASAVNCAHEALAQSGDTAVLSLPLVSVSKTMGAITIERRSDTPFSTDTVMFCEALAALAGPILDVHRREDRWFGARLANSLHEKAVRLFGPGHPGLKLAAAVLVAAVGVLTLVPGAFRVSASSTLEPMVQQAAVAPFDGYVREAPVRPGDLVKEGETLAKLDDRELRLERLKWASQQEELSKQFRAAMADRNAPQVQIVAAQLDQAKAQVARAEEQLARAVLIAPFDGVVASGDLTQQLGAPVERGAVLFELAPLGTFRLVLKVDERDVAYVQPGQRGRLILAAFPSEAVGFEVMRVTPVSTPSEGRNHFRVEAKLDANESRMRPGMEGVAKIEIGREPLAWIWTRQASESLRLALWSWLP